MTVHGYGCSPNWQRLTRRSCTPYPHGAESDIMDATTQTIETWPPTAQQKPEDTSQEAWPTIVWSEMRSTEPSYPAALSEFLRDQAAAFKLQEPIDIVWR